MSCKINFDEDRFFKIFGGDTPENRRWLHSQLGSEQENLVRRLVRVFTDSDRTVSTNIDGKNDPECFQERFTGALHWLKNLQTHTYNEAYARGQEDTRREVAEILGLL